MVKGSKETVLPASRRTANQQTTFKTFTQKFQPNVQGPRKPNTTKADVSRRELENRMERGYKQSIKDMPADEKFELANKVLRDIKRSVSEALTPEQKDAKINYQYKDVTNPKRPVDPVKKLKQEKKGMV